MQTLNTNPNNLVNLLSTKIWSSKFHHKFIQTNSSISKLFKKIRSRKKKKMKMKLKTKTKTKKIIKFNTVRRKTTISKRNNKSTRIKTRMVSTSRKENILKRTRMNMIRIKKCRMNKLLEKKGMKSKN
jgi:hypothetical protein